MGFFSKKHSQEERSSKRDFSKKHSGSTETASKNYSTNKSKKRSKTSASEKKEKVGILQKTPAQIMMPRLLLITSVVILAAIGLVMVYSASSIYAYNESGNPAFYVIRQAEIMGLGIVACIILTCIPYHVWGKRSVFAFCWALTTFLLITTKLGLGVSELGAERSIVIAGFALQPAEFAKITTILSAASLLSMFRQGEIEFNRFLVSIALVIVIPIICIYLQPDLGTAIILLVGILTVAILGGIVWKVILIFIGIGVLYVAYVCIDPGQSYHLERLRTLFNPWEDPSGDGYQIIQSLYAFALGGVNGSGLGFSQEKYLYLPYAHTDFIFAVIGEEFGLIGTIFVVLLFALFAYAGILICRNAPDLLGCMFAGSFTIMIVFQACVNMASVIGLIPVTGKALPFLSYGGSSLLATFIMVGIILSVSFRSRVDIESERKRAAFSVVGQEEEENQGISTGAGGKFTKNKPSWRLHGN